MKTIQAHLKKSSHWDSEVAKLKTIEPQLVMIFGTHEEFGSDGRAIQTAKAFPDALVIGCSTAGEISEKGVFDNTLVVTASHFDHSPEFTPVWAEIRSMGETHQCGVELAQKLKTHGLKSLFVLGRGLEINGSALIEGIRQVVGPDVVITGGLAGDGGRFQKTFTLLNGEVWDNRVVAFGIYSEHIQVAYGSMGGWEPFGPVRRVTKAESNVLYEIDGEPALDIYKRYLGDKAKDLPASGLLYPFALLKDNQDTSGIIRTILGVDEKQKSLVLAGDIDVGRLVRLMHSNNEGLVLGAKQAAEQTVKVATSDLAGGMGILISCVGRKLVMGDDIDDELDAVRSVFGNNVVTGFYSYGEICPQSGFSECKLHNQTMTITYLYEKKAA